MKCCEYGPCGIKLYNLYYYSAFVPIGHLSPDFSRLQPCLQIIDQHRILLLKHANHNICNIEPIKTKVECAVCKTPYESPRKSFKHKDKGLTHL